VLVLALSLSKGNAQPRNGQPAAPTSTAEARAALDALVTRVQDEAKDTLPWDALFPPRSGIQNLSIEGKVVSIDFKANMTDRPWTPASREELESVLRETLGDRIPNGAEIKLTIAGEEFDNFVTSAEQIRQRQQELTTETKTLAAPVVQYPDDPAPHPANGLFSRNIVVGPSHGWYYTDKEYKWQYQRCRLFTIVEDLYPMSYVNPFLIPMLENAGATVFTMRERDFQTAEVIVDNDGDSLGSDFVSTGTWAQGSASGWEGALPPPLAETTEPFTLGTTLEASIAEGQTPSPVASYVPFFPRAGRYAVYVSWAASPQNSPSVPLTVHHLGGATTVRVNQQVAGNTWVFVGFYEFGLGKDPAKGSVLVSAQGAEASVNARNEGKPTLVSIDAVRFGGGIGNVAPDGVVSGHPRYAECCRYYAQYAGAPADLVFHSDVRATNSGRDYTRDIIARPEWTNYINGAPNGPNADRSAPGLGVPIDVSMSLHTDAGISQDGLIGTLSIYRIEDDEENEQFPDGRPRTLNRDLAAMVQDEICRSVRTLYTSEWRRRQLRDGNYGEARRPNMPTVLLELLSHQNFNDMKYGNDPRFKRDVSRAIYKAMLRFIAASNGFDPVISPLEPTHLVARHLGEGRVEITWRPQEDPLEPSARPDGYIVYQSRDGVAFDNGFYVTESRAIVEGVVQDETWYFQVAAANSGGKSFPSRVVAVRWTAGRQPMLLVDGFNRICGPAIVDEPNSRGFSRALDPGVGYRVMAGVTGDQYDQDPKSPFLTNDQPGWGASERDWEDRLERGNTFDSVIPHATALAPEKDPKSSATDPGEPFDSATADAYSDGDVTASYGIIDWIAGRQRTTPPVAGITGAGRPDRMKTEFVVLDAEARRRLEQHLAAGGRLILSGAYIIEDLTTGPAADEDSRRFARDVLGVAGYRPWATRTNAVRLSENPGQFSGVEPFRFGRDLEQTVYSVESAESLEPASALMTPVLSYGDTGKTAALAGQRAVVLGFPIETVLPEKTRRVLLQSAVKHLETPR